MSAVEFERPESVPEFVGDVEAFDMEKELDYYTYEFVGTLLDDVDGQDLSGGSCLLDRDGDDVLLLYRDGTQVFVGRDETASNAGIFGFTVTPGEPVPFVESVSEALDLLQPVQVTERLENDSRTSVVRQGEWFFLETVETPRSRVFKGGVGSRPYNDSPLQNHVPRDYAFGASGEEILNRIEDRVPDLLQRVDCVPDLVEALSNRHDWHWINNFVGRHGEVTFQELYKEVLGGVYVRGTVRHRRKDHSMVSLAEDWHLALTHSLDVRSANPNQIYEGIYVRDPSD